MTTNEETPTSAKSGLSLDTSKASSLLLIFVLIPLVGILAALLLLANQIRNERFNLNGNGNPPNPTALTDFAAPQFQLPSLDGDMVSLADFHGKIVFLNFWQTTCPPCLRELPDFVAFMDEQPDDVTWLTINVDETAQMVEAFFSAHNFSNIPVVLDSDWTVADDYAIIGFPITYVLDTEGIVRYVNIGELSYEQMNLILETVRGET